MSASFYNPDWFDMQLSEIKRSYTFVDNSLHVLKAIHAAPSTVRESRPTALAGGDETGLGRRVSTACQAMPCFFIF